MEEYLRLQSVCSSFLQGVRQHCATVRTFKMTRHFLFMIETAGKDKDSVLSAFALAAETVPSWHRGRSTFPTSFTNLESKEKANKSTISKQLRNLLCNLFVHAKEIYFSDVYITKSLMQDLMVDKRKIQHKVNDRWDFSFTDLNVFETIEHISFIGCTFERAVLSFLAGKLINLKSLMFFNNQDLEYHEIYHFFNKKSKCKSIRFLCHDIPFVNEIIHGDKMTPEEIEVLNQNGLLDVVESPKLLYGIRKEDVEDIIESIPDDVIAIPIRRTKKYTEIEKKQKEGVSTLKETMDLFGVFSNTFSDNEIACQLSGGILKSISNKDTTSTMAVITNDEMIDNIEFLLNNGYHLFDIPYTLYEFLGLAILLHNSNFKLWDMFSRYHFHKLPVFKRNLSVSLFQQFNSVIQNIVRHLLDYEPSSNAYRAFDYDYKIDDKEFVKFLLECKSHKLIHDVNDLLPDFIHKFPRFVKPVVEAGLVNLKTYKHFGYYYTASTESKEAGDYLEATKQEKELKRKLEQDNAEKETKKKK